MEQCRRARGLSYEAIGDHFGLDKSATWRWFHGQTTPQVSHLLDLADLLGVEVEMILRDTPVRRSTELARGLA